MTDRQTYRLKQYTNIALSMLARDKKKSFVGVVSRITI